MTVRINVEKSLIHVQLVVHYCLPLRVPPHALAANAFNEWHVAFHGTASKNVRKILETGGLVLPGQSGSSINSYTYIICVCIQEAR